ncbi:MAG: winged helix-turn-helix domain-containing protein [Acidobacteria bacterium]|nr:winged helix-turn-helix domain-containing protein [Acidobacteriota bacterium]
MLTLLLEHRGRVVTREKIIEALWPDTFVDENNLSVTVSMLRKAFGESASSPKFIETIPRKGYRFNADVTESATSLVITESETMSTVIEHTEIDDGNTVALAELRSGLRRQQYILVPVAAALIALFAFVGWTYFRGGNENSGSGAGTSRPIAVLPFRDLSGDERSKQISIGLADSLVTKLASIPELTVRPTSSVIALADGPYDVKAAVERLKVENYLEGTIQNNAGQMKVSVQLVRAADGFVIWAESFEDSAANILKLQDAIAMRVFSAMRIKVSPGKRETMARKESSNAEANSLYLRARYFWNKRGTDNIKRSIELFEEAVEKDPAFALGFVGISDAYQMLSEYGGIERKLAMDRARAAVTRAIELDDQMGEAYCSLGYLQAFYDWDFEAAEVSFKRAIELSPNHATAHQWFGELRAAQGRWEEGIVQMRRAAEIDPVSPIILTDVASLYYIGRRYNDAIETALKVEELVPNFAMAHYFLAFSYAQKGMEEETKKYYHSADATWIPGLKNSGDDSYSTLSLKELYKRRYRNATNPPLSDYLNGYQKAMAAVLAGDHDGTFMWLEVALAGRDRWFVNLPMDPIWDPIRSDPRYAELLRRGGLRG